MVKSSKVPKPAKPKAKPKAKTKKELLAEANKLIDLRNSTEPCRRCDRFAICDPAMNGVVGRHAAGDTGTAKYYFLDTIPSREEVRKGRVRVGVTEFEFYELFTAAGIKEQDVYHDVLVRCGTYDEPRMYDSGDILRLSKNCLPYTLNEIERASPKVIFTVGDRPLYALTGLQGAHVYEGRVLPYRALNAVIVPLLDYDYILARKERQERTIEIMKRAAKLGAMKFRPYRTIPVLDSVTFDDMIAKIKAAEAVVVDSETASLNPFVKSAWVIGVSFAVNGDEGYFLPFRKPVDTEAGVVWSEEPNITKAQADKVRAILRDRKKIKILHNVGFDRKYLTVHGFPVEWPFIDTMLMNTVLDNTENGLKELTWVHTDMGGYEQELDEAIQARKAEMRKEKRRVSEFSYADLPADKLMRYGGYDAIATYRLYESESKGIEPHQIKLIKKVCEMRHELSDMELRGVRVDLEKTAELIPKYEAEIATIQAQIDKAVGRSINLNSTAQLTELLYGVKGLFPHMKQGSTDAATVKFLLHRMSQRARLTKKERAAQNVLTLLQNFRKRDKLLSTYLYAFRDQNHNGRMHTTFTQEVTRTKRLSSMGPNLQNVPRKGDIKDLFIPDPGKVMAELDASQLELRIAANESEDPLMLDLLNSGQDIHSVTGVSSIMRPDGTPYEIEYFMSGSDKFDEDLRAAAKIVGFSVIYGKTARGLAVDLNVSVERAAAIQSLFFKKYPQLAEWVERQHRFVESHRFVTTKFGRKLYIWGGDSHDEFRVAEAHRKSVNYPIQSAAADCVTVGITRLGQFLRREKVPIELLLTVHDSILLQGEAGVLKTYLPVIRDVLEQPIEEIQFAKLYFDCKVGDRWGSLKKYNMTDEIKAA